MLKLLAGFCLLACAWAKHEVYDGHALYDVSVNFVDQIKTLEELKNLDIDVWADAVPGRHGKVLVPKILRQRFEEALTADGIDFQVEVENIKEKLDLEDTLLKNARSKRNGTARGSISYEGIHTYDEVNAILENMARTYPQTVTLVNGGKSIEGRDINYLKISSDGFQSNKPVIFLQSLLHGRAWATLPITLYAIQKLVVDVTEGDLLQNVDWIILPIANPDGYVYSELYRFYRKNLRKGFLQGDICYGVDLNRNFDINWAEASNNNPCRDDFHGLHPFSEPEAVAIRDIFTQYSNRIELYIDVHSFGSRVIYGYGSGQLPINALGLQVLGVNMAQAIDSVKWDNHPNYEVGNTMLVSGRTSGSANDYALAIGVPFSYAIDLPSYISVEGILNQYLGFFVDPEFNEQMAHQNWEAIKVAARFVQDLRRKGQ